MHIRMTIVGLVLAILVTIAGCYYPEAFYQEPPRPPIEKGRIAEQQHDYVQAEQHYQQIDDMLVRDMALNHLSAAWESVNATIIRSQEAMTQQPGSAKAHLQLAQDYYSKGLLCTRYSREAAGDYPRDFVLGEQEYYYREALNHAQKALRFDPNLPEVHLLIGEIYLANWRNDEALKELKQLIKKHPDFARGYYAIGKVYFDMKKYDLIERYLIRTILLDPNVHDAYYLLGKFYLEKNWLDYAAFTFLELLKRNPTDRPTFDLLIEACHKLGKYYMQEEQYAQAIQLFQEILRVQSSYDVHQSLLLARQKQEEARLKVLEAEQQAEEAAQAAQQAQNTSESQEAQPEQP